MISTKASSGITVQPVGGATTVDAESVGNGLKKIMSSVARASWFSAHWDDMCILSTNPAAIVLSADVLRFKDVDKQTARLWSMANVEDGWDGREAKAPSHQCLVAAHNLLNAIGRYQNIPVPIASVNSSGQSNLFWNFDGFYADVDIDEDKVEFFVKGNEQDEGSYYEEPLTTGQIPSTLLMALLIKCLNAETESMP